MGPAFTLFGFPTTIRAGFVVFMALIALVNPGAAGLWLAGAILVFTIIHELGHAVMARRFGAQAEIALDFLAGYTAYTPTHPLTAGQRGSIAVAGPVAEIVPGVLLLLALGTHPFDFSEVFDSPVTAAIWWAGPFLGAVNLLPVLPLDGGVVSASVIDAAFPGRGRPIMTVASLVITAALLVVLLGNSRLRPLWFIGIVLAALQISNLAALRRPKSGARSAGQTPDTQRMQAALWKQLQEAEAQSWAAERPARVPLGGSLSPWFHAYLLMRGGDLGRAQRTLESGFEGPANWAPPTTATLDQIEPLVDLLPEPLPHGAPYPTQVLQGMLHRVGRYGEAARYGAAAFAASPSPALAVGVARSAARIGDHDQAARWLETAARSGGNGPALAAAIDHDPELAAIRQRPDVQAVRQVLGG